MRLNWGAYNCNSILQVRTYLFYRDFTLSIFLKCLTERRFVPLFWIHCTRFISSAPFTVSQIISWEKKRGKCVGNGIVKLLKNWQWRIQWECVSLLIRTDSYKVSLPEDFPFSQCSRPTANNRGEIHIDWRQQSWLKDMTEVHISDTLFNCCGDQAFLFERPSKWGIMLAKSPQ